MSNIRKAAFFSLFVLAGAAIAIVLQGLGVPAMLATVIGGAAIGAPIGILLRERQSA
ncbi:hypothetical protein [Stenotrophomonas panacihumi]|uniref:hypothetical protein n=1 Tax=Stenotrophomonas panacihumi TaxID=676599 RepID=UPI001379925B|nr:hypothetical protein [Stenotrophomonas panacihumi]